MKVKFMRIDWRYIWGSAIISALAAIAVPYANQSHQRHKFDLQSEEFRRTHPQLAYSIEPVDTCCATENPDVLKVHDRGFRSYIPNQGSLSWLRQMTLGDSIYLVSFSPSSRYLAIVAGPSTVIIWDVQNKREQSRFYYREGSDINKILWAPDDRFITMGHVSGPETADSGADVWDPKTGKPVAKLKGYPLFSAISPDGTKIISRIGHYVNEQPVYYWRLYNTSDWTYRDLAKQPGNPHLVSCEDKRRNRVIYGGVTWTSNDRVASFGFLESNSKEVTCTLDGENPLPNGLFVEMIDPSSKAAPLVKNLQFNKFGDTGNPDPAQNSGYASQCNYAYSDIGKFIVYASGITINPSSLNLRRPNIKYNTLPSCSYYTPDSTGNYIYSVDSSNPNNMRSKAVGKVQSVKTGNLVSTFPVDGTSFILGGVSASPDGRYLAVTSYNIVDIYRTR